MRDGRLRMQPSGSIIIIIVKGVARHRHQGDPFLPQMFYLLADSKLAVNFDLSSPSLFLAVMFSWFVMTQRQEDFCVGVFICLFFCV